MPSVITLAVYALAVARVTRLITKDKITQALRERVVNLAWSRACTFCSGEATPVERRNAVRLYRATAETPLSVYLLTCAWCVSIWVSLVATPLIWAFGTSPWLFWPAVALALSHMTGLLSQLEG